MSRIVFLFCVVILTVSWHPFHAIGGGGRTVLIPQTSAHRFGLERAWFTRAAVDSGRGRIRQLRQHVSSTETYTIFELTFDGGKINFSERDFDRYGERLKKAGAERLARQKLEDLERFQLNPKLTVQTIPVITLYLATDRGIVQAVDGETGRTRWISEIGNPDHLIEPLGVNDQFVAAASGSEIYVLNTANGTIAWRRRLLGSPGAGPVLSDNLMFIPMIDGAMEAYSLEDHRQPPWLFRSIGRTVAQPIYNGSIVAWPTNRGYLYVAQADMTNVLFNVATNRSIAAGAAALPPGRLLIASNDGYLYCVQESDGAVLWQFSTGERISRSPVVVGDAIYVVTDDAGMFRISGKGDEVWRSSGVTSFLAASGERLYGRTVTGQMLILDTETGARIGTLATEVLDLQIRNKLTDRVFVGTRSGLIQCLHEVQNEWPMVHVAATEVPQDQPQRAPTTPPPDAAPSVDPAESTNPFDMPADTGGDPVRHGKRTSG